MKAEQLRKSILQYAIQGKLVPQIDTEEPAGELLKKIKTEKQELIKQGKIKKEKPLPPITDKEKPFDIPDSWEWARFSEIVSFDLGKTPDRKNSQFWNNGEYNWVSIADLRDKETIYQTKEKISQKAYNELFGNGLSEIGTLLMSFKLTIGKVSILGCDAFHNEAIVSIYPFINIGDIIKIYLFHTLCLIVNYADSTDAIKGSTLNSTKMKTMLVPLPPLAEQQRIVARIEELMALVDEYEKKEIELSKLEKEFPEKLKKSILQYAIQGEFVPQIDTEEPASELLKKIKAEKQELIIQGKIKKQKDLPLITDEEKPFEIPDSWEWVRLGECFSIIRGSSPRPKGSPLYWSKDKTTLHWITIKDITNNLQKGLLADTNEYLTPKGAELSTFIKSGELIIAVSGSTTGKHCLTGIDGYIYDGLAAVLNDTQQINSWFLNLYFDWMYEILNAQKAGSAFPNINTDILKNSLFPLPPLAEQQRIVTRVEKLFALVDLISSGKKPKIAEDKTALKTMENIIELKPRLKVEKHIDISSFGLVAREDGEVTQSDLDTALGEVQDFYDKEKN